MNSLDGSEHYATMSSVDRIGGLQQVQAGPPAVFRRNDITYRQCCEYDEDMSAS